MQLPVPVKIRHSHPQPRRANADKATKNPCHTMKRLLALSTLLLLGGCVDQINKLLEDPKAVQREADARAIGAACRFGMRSIEDCYVLNEKAAKSAVFAGWKEMDQYMRENKVEGVPAKLEKAAAPAPEPKEEIVEEKPASTKKAKTAAAH